MEFNLFPYIMIIKFLKWCEPERESEVITKDLKLSSVFPRVTHRDYFKYPHGTICQVTGRKVQWISVNWLVQQDKEWHLLKVYMFWLYKSWFIYFLNSFTFFCIYSFNPPQTDVEPVISYKATFCLKFSRFRKLRQQQQNSVHRKDLSMGACSDRVVSAKDGW